MSTQFEDFEDELEKQADKVSRSKYLEAKTSLDNIVLPLMRMFFDAVDERFAETEDAIGTILTQADSILQPDIAEKIMECLNAGAELAASVGTPEAEALAVKFKSLFPALCELIAELTISEEVDDVSNDDEDEDEASDESSDEDDSTDIAATAGPQENV
jgi:uncharacterized protein YjgD (DUF1641 family)